MIAEAMQKVGNQRYDSARRARRQALPANLDGGRGHATPWRPSPPYFVTNAEKMNIELDQPYILIHEKKLSDCNRCCRCWKQWHNPVAHC